MESASPTATASTNRGGRPKDWNETRTRRMIRLYCYTRVPMNLIMRLIEEDDFCPGKDAANKVKHHVLGNDPRWLRPRDDNEEQSRVRALRNSLRGRRSNNRAKAPQGTPAPDACADALPPANNCPEARSLAGTTIAQSHRSSLDDPEASAFAHASDPRYPYIPHDSAPAFHGVRSFGPRDPNRQGTGFTDSTDISITNSIANKLSTLSLTRVKRAFKVLKRYTFPANGESETEPPATFTEYESGEGDGLGAGHAVPGDFLKLFYDDALLARRQMCAEGCISHPNDYCWCALADEVWPTQAVWDACQVPSSNLASANLTVKDVFGNTAFHRLAADDSVQDLFMHNVDRALQVGDLTLFDKNEAGQTPLHVLHASWFREGSRLQELLRNLQQCGRFDILATDVYGRNFYHIWRYHVGDSIRVPSSLGLNLNHMNRRDAFGMRPMEKRASRNLDFTNIRFQAVQRADTAATMSSMRQRASVPAINTQLPMNPSMEKELTANASLLRVVNDAISTETSRNAPSEDSLGRNAYHCLAELRRDLEHKAQSTPDTPVPKPQHSNSNSSKRKFNEEEEVDTPQSRSENRKAGFMKALRDVHTDANQYDLQGHTPLMAFVINSADTTKPEKDDGEQMIRELVQNAGANLESRNRQGETALHLAAKNGKPIAVRVLLDLGANPHTRNSQGLGILEVLDRLYMATAEHDDKNNARFEACRAVLTTRTGTGNCAVQHPTVIQEWGAKDLS